MAQTVFSDVADDTRVQEGTLFQGLKFWLSHKVPQRSRFINDVRVNGGEILPIEKHADIRIVDHARKEALPGTYSYTFIEKSVLYGVLEDLQDHKAGPSEGAVRSIGSVVQPAKGTRNKFTQDDDRVLWNWVHENPQKGGGTDGNEIYKQLEAKHPQHPWQSWRDHWIKQLKGKASPFSLPLNAPPTPPSDLPLVRDNLATMEEPKELKAPSGITKLRSASFQEEDAEALMENGASILEIHPDNVAEAWEKWAHVYDKQRNHTAHDWQQFWEDHVCQKFLKRLSKRTEAHSTEKEASAAQILTHSKSRKNALSSSPPPINNVLPMGTNLSKSPTPHPESPSIQLRSPSLHPQKSKSTNTHTITDGPCDSGREILTIDERLKRKRAALEEELPSSSPPQTKSSPKRIRQNRPSPIREIASTPDRTPTRAGIRPSSPLFIESEDDEEDKDEGLDNNNAVNESALEKEPSHTFSEPDHVMADTQDILRAATQRIDFDIPLPNEEWDSKDFSSQEPSDIIDLEVPQPEGGWDDKDLKADVSSESEFPANGVYESRPIRQGTQALLRGQTAAPDFDVVEPEGGWDNAIPSSPPPMPSSPPAESEVSDVDAQMDAWINAHATEGLTIDKVLSTLKCTSMNTDLAEVVFESMKKGDQVPENQRGVWTEIDDEDLGSTDARKIQRLELKHGKDCLTARWEFLSFYGSA